VTQKTSERAVLLMQAMPVACGLMTPDYELVEFNRAAIEMFALQKGKPFYYKNPEDGEISRCHGICEGCPLYKEQHNCVAHQCLVKNWRHTIPGYLENPERWSQARSALYQKAVDEGSVTISMDRITLLGHKIHIEITVVPVEYKGGQGFALYLRDLSETRLREAAQEESRIKTQFLARMSHEIRTPMNAVLGITEIQLQKGTHPPETEEAFLRIHNSSKMLLSIINDILDFSKVEAGKMEIVPVVYDIADLIVDPVQLNLMNIGSKQIGFELTVDKNLPAAMIGDEIRIKQIINNLLSNAIKYTEEGQILLSFECEEIPDSSEIMIIIRVKDTGQGMTEEQKNSLFEKEFTRFNLQHNRSIEGTGLGMTIAYNLVSLMNGSIEVESQPDEGSTFTVCIPQKTCNGEVLGEEAAKSLQNLDEVKNSFKKLAQFDRVTMPYGRVLVVDDVESNLFVAKGLLEPYKLVVETARSGIEAIELIKTGNEYDIIFMDHMMPEMDGIEAAKAIKALSYDHPIIALTANIIMGQAEVFLNAGFAGYISKPINPAILDDHLKLFIQDNRLPETLTTAPIPTGLSPALIGSFLRDATRVKDVLTEILRSPELDIKLYTINIHAMKSALANIGQANISDFAYTLEQAGRENDVNAIRSFTPVFLKSLDSLVKTLVPKETTASPDKDEDPDFLNQQLKIIHDACENYNKKSAKEALNALTDKNWSLKTKEKLDNISALLLHSDFEAVVELTS